MIMEDQKPIAFIKFLPLLPDMLPWPNFIVFVISLVSYLTVPFGKVYFLVVF